MKKKAYRCFDKETNKVVVSHDVSFDEGSILHSHTNIPIPKEKMESNNAVEKTLLENEVLMK